MDILSGKDYRVDTLSKLYQLRNQLENCKIDKTSLNLQYYISFTDEQNLNVENLRYEKYKIL